MENVLCLQLLSTQSVSSVCDNSQISCVSVPSCVSDMSCYSNISNAAAEPRQPTAW